MNEQVVAPREKNFDVSGVGCLIQFLGLLAPTFFSLFMGYLGGAIGLVFLVIMFFAGSAKHTKWICGNCKTPIDSEEVTMCATCDAQLR